MGQATSSPNALSFFQKVTNSDKSEYEDITHTFSKATLSTLTVPVIIIAYPALNAYAFQDMDITGHRMVDGAIGGLLGVIACKKKKLLPRYRYIYVEPLFFFVIFRAIISISRYLGCS